MLYTQFTNELALAVEKVCSTEYEQMFEVAAREQPVYPSFEQKLILQIYPNCITWYIGDRRQEIIDKFRCAHLIWFNKWLSENNTGLPPYVEWNLTMVQILLHLTNLLFRIDRGDIIANSETREECQHIAVTVHHILLTIRESNSTIIDQAAMPLVRVLLQIFFYFTLDNDLAIYLKNLQLVDLMNVLIGTCDNDNEIHLHAYRILAVIMAEADIKQLQNSNRIATVFITFIRNTIDGGPSTEDRLHNNLRSLNVLAQHDQIREELIKQGGYSLFLRCALEDQFKPLKAKLPALNILLALAFDKNFATVLKENTVFMDHVRTLTSSPEKDLQRVASALIWSLEKEPDTAVKNIEDQHVSSSTPIIAKKKHDIMISYSHSDKELCHYILERLKQDKLHIWIDSQEIHGNMADVIAEAIENSDFVLICMSDSYKQSSICKSEASYAVKCQCHIIPLVMTAHYKADGWLGLLTSGYIYVDFRKSNFDTAYEQLKCQIERNRTNLSHSKEVTQDQRHDDHSSLINTVPKTLSTVVDSNEPRPVVEYPHCIDSWTADHVKSFLLDKKLNALLGAFEGMNGRLLHKAYVMCQANQQTMFSSLKEDVIQSQYKVTLSLKDYLIFLEEIKAYIPYTTDNRLNSTSAVCNLM